MKRIAALLLIGALVFIGGCNTLKGMGRDVEKAGEWVQEKAQ